MWISVLLFVFCLLFILLRRHYNSIKLAGPVGLPYFGNVFQLDTTFPMKTLYEWTEKYGKMFKMTMFGSDVVVVSDPEVIREVLVTKAETFADRPKSFRTSYLYDKGEIVFSAPTKQWALTKRLTMTGLKLVGDGLDRLESIAHNVLENMIDDIKNQNREPFDLWPLLYTAICNINGTMIYGCEFTPEEVNLIVKLDTFISETISSAGQGMLLDLCPYLRYLPNKAFEKLSMAKKEKDLFFGKLAEDAKKAFKERPEQYCCLTELLKYTEKSQDDMILPLRDVATTLQGGGNITTIASIHAFTGIMAANLDLQRRCQEEVRKVIGSRKPSLNDRSSFPFMESMILELLRYLSHVPVLIPHQATKDTSLMGTSIPKGTQIWINAWHLHHNPALWDEPWEFKPDRFLDEQGQLLPPGCTLRRQLCFFGAGKRVCVGEMLARNRLFIFLTTILQTFTLCPEKEGTEIPCDPRQYNHAIILTCKPFKLRAIPNNWSG